MVVTNYLLTGMILQVESCGNALPMLFPWINGSCKRKQMMKKHFQEQPVIIFDVMCY